MKLSLNWLKDYIDPKLSVDALSDRLVMAGWEVEAVEKHGADTVLELEITPNRPDCLNVLGLAREIGAINSKQVKFPKIKAHKPTKNKVAIAIEDKRDCRRYIGTLIKNVNVAPAPRNIQERINAVGTKSISNAVDVTNFVLMEIGQPLHVFDYDKLEGGKIIVRHAKAGEKILTIDGIERSLDPSILVIADAKKPVAIAGIMGGKDTEVTSSTKNILLESAHFDMTLVRRASRKLGLRSDSSYRFERNVDFNGVLIGANRATDLLLELTRGSLAARTDLAYPIKNSLKAIKITEQDVESLLGLKLPLDKIRCILTDLEFKISSSKNALSVVPPSYRGDVKETVDLIEEVARITGFDRMPTSLPQIKAQNVAISDRPVKIKRLIRQSMLACGLNEAVTLSMLGSKEIEKCLLQDVKTLKVYNPLTIDQEYKRPSLLPSLLNVTLTNFNRGQRDLKLFEIGKRYSKDGEKDTLAILMTGKRHADWRLPRKETLEIFDLKGVIENLAQSLKLEFTILPTQANILENNSSASIKLQGVEIGFLGKVRKQILTNWEIKNQDVYFASVHLETILSLPKTVQKYQPLIEFPAVVRDVSVAVKREVSYEAIEKICRQKSAGLLRDVKFIEQYIGDKVAADQKALVFSLVYQNPSRTLREDEVNLAHETIVNTLIKDLGATRR